MVTVCWVSLKTYLVSENSGLAVQEYHDEHSAIDRQVVNHVDKVTVVKLT